MSSTNVPEYLKFKMIQPVGQLGMKTPSDYLRLTTRQLGEFGISNQIAIRTAFVKGLPEKLRNVATVANFDTLDELAQRLDEIHETQPTDMFSQYAVNKVEEEKNMLARLNDRINVVNDNLSKIVVNGRQDEKQPSPEINREPLTLPPITTQVIPPIQTRQDVTLSLNAVQTFPRETPIPHMPAGNDAERQVTNQQKEKHNQETR